ncbi:MAG TPA: hypothetical protein ENJ82_10070, partial [Bacteroidetes bacterium]|nr:hypothetical protein [Bacteroidota bacterium]
MPKHTSKTIFTQLLLLFTAWNLYSQTSPPPLRHIQLDQSLTAALTEAQDIASGRDGSVAMISGLFYSGNNGNQVDFFDRNQNHIWELTTTAYYFHTLAIESDSAIWIGGSGPGNIGNTLEKRDHAGNRLLQISLSGGKITHMVTDTANNLFAYNAGGLMKFTAQGTLIWAKSYSGFTALTRLIYNPNHTLSLVSGSQVIILDLNGNILFSKNVTGGIVLIYPDHSITIVNPNTYQVAKYDSSGTNLWSVAVSVSHQGYPHAAAVINTGGTVFTYPYTYSVHQSPNCNGPFISDTYGYVYLDRNGVEKSGDFDRASSSEAIVKRLKEDVNGDILLSESNYMWTGFSCLSRGDNFAQGTRWVFEGACPQDPPRHPISPVPAFGSIQALTVSVTPVSPTISPRNIASQLRPFVYPIFGCCSKAGLAFTFTQQVNSFQFTSSIFYQDSIWWDFGDGTTDSTEHPSHIFNTQMDSIRVCLFAKNACGIDSTCTWVRFCSDVQFSPHLTEICVGDSISFVNTSDSGLTFSWFDNGVLLSTDTQITWIASSPGLHNISLLGDNGLCQTIDSTIIQTFGQPPTAGFTYSHSNLALSFSDTSQNATSWYWDFGDGDTSTAQFPLHTYLGSGTYNICQIATNSCGSDTFCTVFSCNVALSNFGAYQYLDSLYFTDSSTNAQKWYWDFDDGST